jgi:hypothetical protein
MAGFTTPFTCFTSTKVQILTLTCEQCVDVDECWVVEDAKGTNKSATAGVSICTQSICVSSTKVQILSVLQKVSVFVLSLLYLPGQRYKY